MQSKKFKRETADNHSQATKPEQGLIGIATDGPRPREKHHRKEKENAPKKKYVVGQKKKRTKKGLTHHDGLNRKKKGCESWFRGKGKLTHRPGGKYRRVFHCLKTKGKGRGTVI